LDPVTPSKWKGVRVEQNTDEPTDIAVPQAPWDASSQSEETEAEEPVVDDAPSINPTDHFPIPRKPKGVITSGDQPAPAKAAPAPDDAYLEAGTVLGEYRIEGQIGEGGMGVVYAAVHPLIGKRAAVKVLKAELCRSAFNVERFIDEARIVNQIGHPNIVDVFAFGQTTDGRSYFVMEWLKGESLRARIARSRLDLDEICEVIRPLARALEAAHEQGVIHRDLKPDNIFLVELRGEVPRVKLLDFGIAKLAREEHRMERTATGAMVGTPQYIAPEQAKGYSIDHRVDIYALGGILFELLTGRSPFVADNAMEMVAKHLMEAPPRPSTLTYVPPELDDLVLRMLSKDPDGRPTLAEVATVIERTSALDRTNVKTPIPRAPSAPINIPTPTPPSSPNLEKLARHPVRPGSNPSTAQAPSDVVAVADPNRAASSSGIGKKGILLLGVGVLAMAAVAFAAVSMLSTKKHETSKVESVVQPEPPKTEPANTIAKTELPTAEPPKTEPANTIAKTELPTAEPLKAEAKTEPAKTEPAARTTAKATPPKAETQTKPPKVEVKTEPAKTDPPKVEAKAELAKTEPPKVEEPAKREPAKIEPKTEPAKPTAKVTPPKETPKPPPAKKPKPGRLELQISGGKAPRILIDGNASGPTKELAPGTHTVKITSPGSKPVSLNVTIHEGATQSKRITLEPDKPPKDPKNDLMAPGSLEPKRTK